IASSCFDFDVIAFIPIARRPEPLVPEDQGAESGVPILLAIRRSWRMARYVANVFGRNSRHKRNANLD
ncbi:hypothetical protein, partial [Burkholderia ubonensis]|uniref:hypothetical protein n=1 Tax=Burkholderia ubonensis TaxID=101571 RepID=UPI001E6525BD